MAPPDDELDPALHNQIQAFFTALRRSAEIAQELSRTTTAHAERIRSLETDLASARSRIHVLESELGRVRATLGGSDANRSLAQLDALVEEQNCLAHLFVTSDRLALSRSPQAALQVAIEILHNLIGAHRYGIYLRFESDGEALLVAPSNPRYRATGKHQELVARLLDSGADAGRPARGVTGLLPICLPVRLEGTTVGALVIDELVPQLGGTFPRLQRDLLSLVAERLAPSMCVGALRGTVETAPLEYWASLKKTIAEIARDGGAA
jgi:hypothetical protein